MELLMEDISFKHKELMFMYLKIV